MSAKHTPGPWEVVGELHGYSKGMIHVSGMGRNRAVADVYPLPACGEGVHNANLIAAAPDLLEALRDMLAQAGGQPKTCGHEPFCACPFDAARAAIAKAEGAA